MKLLSNLASPLNGNLHNLAAEIINLVDAHEIRLSHHGQYQSINTHQGEVLLNLALRLPKSTQASAITKSGH